MLLCYYNNSVLQAVRKKKRLLSIFSNDICPLLIKMVLAYVVPQETLLKLMIETTPHNQSISRKRQTGLQNKACNTRR